MKELEEGSNAWCNYGVAQMQGWRATMVSPPSSCCPQPTTLSFSDVIPNITALPVRHARVPTPPLLHLWHIHSWLVITNIEWSSYLSYTLLYLQVEISSIFSPGFPFSKVGFWPNPVTRHPPLPRRDGCSIITGSHGAAQLMLHKINSQTQTVYPS